MSTINTSKNIIRNQGYVDHRDLLRSDPSNDEVYYFILLNI